MVKGFSGFELAADRHQLPFAVRADDKRQLRSAAAAAAADTTKWNTKYSWAIKMQRITNMRQ